MVEIRIGFSIRSWDFILCVRIDCFRIKKRASNARIFMYIYKINYEFDKANGLLDKNFYQMIMFA